MTPPSSVECIEWERKLPDKERKDKSNRVDHSSPTENEDPSLFQENRSFASPKALAVSPSSAFAKPHTSPASVLDVPTDNNVTPEDDEERFGSPSPPTIISSSSSRSPSHRSPNQRQHRHGSSNSSTSSHRHGSCNSSTSSPTRSKKAPSNGLTLRLHPLMEKSDWKRLEACVKTLQTNAAPQDVEIALGMLNVQGENPLHAAARLASPELFLSILELVPIDHRDEYLLQKDEKGNTPLHTACANVNSSDFCAIKNLILLAPQTLEDVNENKDTPLHLLVTSPAFQPSEDFLVEAAAEEAISSLVMMAGHLATYPNMSGATLLHIAISVGAHELVIMKLIELAPISVQLHDQQGNLPIHHAAAFGGTPWIVAAQLVEVYPDSIFRQNQNGDTPLHLLMVNGHKFVNDGHVNRNATKLAELLIGSGHLCQDAEHISSPLLIENNDCLTPLHASVLYDTPSELMRLLYNYVKKTQPTVWSQASVLATTFGATPLHLACAASSKKEKSRDAIAIIEALATRKVCKAADCSGRTPLIVAVQNKKISKRVIYAIVKAYPKSARLATESGHLPLHLAVQSRRARKKVVRILVRAYPASVYAVTCSRNTALHEACEHRAPLNVVKYLLDKNEQAMEERNGEGLLPIEVAKRNRASKKVVEYLEERQIQRNKLKEEASIKRRLGRC